MAKIKRTSEPKNKMELMAEEIVKLLKGFKIAEANITLDNVRALINWNTKVK